MKQYALEDFVSSPELRLKVVTLHQALEKEQEAWALYEAAWDDVKEAEELLAKAKDEATRRYQVWAKASDAYVQARSALV